MHITSITAAAEEIRFTLSEPVAGERLHVSVFPAAVGEEGELCSVNVTVQGDTFSIGRRLSGRDGLTCRYIVSGEHGEVEGKKYVEHIEPQTPFAPYPSSRRGVILQEPADTDALLSAGVRHAALFVSLPDFLMLYPEGEDTILYRSEGRDYYIRKSTVEYVDRCLLPLTEAGTAVTLILVNAREWLFSAGDRLWSAVICPDADPAAEYAMFDTVRESGCGYFRAFVTFLQKRYDPACLVIGYDVNDPACTAGETDLLESFAERYITALRVAYQSTGGGVRICAAVTDHGGQRAEALLTALSVFSRLEGDFPWHVALHPTGNTAEAVRTLSDFLSLPEIHFDGSPRYLILTETEADGVPAEAYAVFSVVGE